MGEVITCGWVVTALAIVGAVCLTFSGLVVAVAAWVVYMDHRAALTGHVDGWALMRAALVRVWSWPWELVAWWTVGVIIAAGITWSVLVILNEVVSP